MENKSDADQKQKPPKKLFSKQQFLNKFNIKRISFRGSQHRG